MVREHGYIFNHGQHMLETIITAHAVRKLMAV